MTIFETLPEGRLALLLVEHCRVKTFFSTRDRPSGCVIDDILLDVPLYRSPRRIGGYKV